MATVLDHSMSIVFSEFDMNASEGVILVEQQNCKESFAVFAQVTSISEKHLCLIVLISFSTCSQTLL